MPMKTAAVAFAILAASPAWAEVAPFAAAPAKAVQTKTYYETSAQSTCESSVCIVYFPKIKGAEAVLFKRVSCTAVHTGPIYAAAFGVVERKGSVTLTPSVSLAITPSVAANGVRYTQFNQEVLLRIPAGGLPSAGVATTTVDSLSMICTATGSPD